MKFFGIISSALFAFAMANGASAAAFRGAAMPQAKGDAEDRALTGNNPFEYYEYPHEGCRTSDGGKGVEGHHYEKYSHLDKYECEKLCNDYGYDCKAYEIGSNGHCEIWFKPVPRTGHAPGLTCFVKKFDDKNSSSKSSSKSTKKSTKDDEEYYYYDNNHNKVCRTSNGGKGDEGKDYYKYDNIYDCAELCDEFGYDCKAYESGPHGHCEIWVRLPVRFADNHGYNCALKKYY